MSEKLSDRRATAFALPVGGSQAAAALMFQPPFCYLIRQLVPQ